MQPRLTTRVGEIVRAERQRQGLKQEELALAAGVSYRTVLQIEKGKRTSRVDVLVRVLEALGLTLDVRSASRSLSGTESEPLAYFEIAGDAEGFRWSLTAANGQTLASSPADFRSRRAALGALRQLVATAAAADPSAAETRVFRGDDGAYRWHLKASDGQLVATSSGRFQSRQSARRAARYALLAASTAEVR